MPIGLMDKATNCCRPCASRDPPTGLLDVLRLSAVQQTLWDIVRRDDKRPCEARLGTQGESRSRFYREARSAWAGVVRAACIIGSRFCPRAADQEMEASLENSVDRSKQPAMGRPLSVDCSLMQAKKQVERWVPACAGTTRKASGRSQ